MSKKIIHTLAILSGLALITIGLSACGSNTKNSTSSTSFKSELIKKDTLTVGLEGVYPPYSYRKDGKLTGFEVELVHRLGKELDTKVNIVPNKWDGLIAGVGSKRFDFVVDNITATPERKKQYSFTEPYIYSHYVLVTKKGSSIKSVNDIKSKKFAEGTGSDNEQVAKKFGATIVPNGNFETSVEMIKTDRVDGTINAVSAWQDYKKSNSTSGLTATTIPSSDVKPAETAALLSKKSPKLRKALNKAFDKLRADGTLKKLSIKYFGTDITEK